MSNYPAFPKKIVPKPECHVDHSIISSSKFKFVDDIKPAIIYIKDFSTMAAVTKIL